MDSGLIALASNIILLITLIVRQERLRSRQDQIITGAIRKVADVLALLSVDRAEAAKIIAELKDDLEDL